jgi:hypothetical protein
MDIDKKIFKNVVLRIIRRSDGKTGGSYRCRIASDGRKLAIEVSEHKSNRDP